MNLDRFHEHEPAVKIQNENPLVYCSRCEKPMYHGDEAVLWEGRIYCEIECVHDELDRFIEFMNVEDAVTMVKVRRAG